MNMVDDFIENIVNIQAKNLDKSIITFLEENGYKVPDVITIGYLEELKNELAKENKFVDTLQWTEYDFKNNSATHHVIPFFNRISNPLKEKEKDKIIARFRKNGL